MSRDRNGDSDGNPGRSRGRDADRLPSRDPDPDRDRDGPAEDPDGVEDEIRFHLEMRTRANLEAGMEPGEARADAERRFGDADRVRSAGRRLLGGAASPGRRAAGAGGGGRGGRRSRGRAPARRGATRSPRGGPAAALGRWLSALGDDLRFGGRMLARHRFTTAAAVLSLALGIGANTANFSIVHGVLFRPLPFEGGDRLLFVDAWNPERGDGDAPITWADLEALRDSDVFAGVEAFTTRSFTVTGGDRPERVAGAAVTPGLFELLGVRPGQGRLFREGEGAEPGFEQVALLGDGLWRRMFGADPEIVGETVHLNGREIVVVGIMEPGFRFPEREDLWLPLGTDDATDHRRRYITGIARLAEGGSLPAARDVVTSRAEQAAADFPDTHEGWTLRAQWFRHGWVDASSRQLLGLLLAAVGFVLLLACANVANLLLARAADRRQELAVRSALGAGGGRLAHQVLVESLLLGLAGGTIGVALAAAWVEAFARAVPEEMAFWMDITVDGRVLLYALAVSLGTSLLFGMLPALQASRARLGSVVRQSGRGILGGRGRARSGLVMVEVGLAVVLLVSATLMVRSFLALQEADPGFDDSSLLSLRIIQAGDHYDDPAARATYFRQVGERLATVAGAVAAVATSAIPADDGGSSIRVLPDGTPEDEALYASAIVSTRGLFETLGVELLAGRDFTALESVDPGADVALVGERLARRLWPGRDPLGRRLVLPGTGDFRVIGVAPDLQYEEFGEDLEGARLQVHVPYGVSGSRAMAVLVSAAGDPASLVAPVRDALAGIDPTLAPYDIMTMRQRRSLTTWPQRLFGNSFAAFGLIALVLAVGGIHGVIAYSVARRTREIGIRIALGARPAAVRTRVVGDALRLAGAGAAVGLLVALAFASALRGALYGVSATDPAVFAGVLVTLLLAAGVASWMPARRAAAIDPTEALRRE